MSIQNPEQAAAARDKLLKQVSPRLEPRSAVEAAETREHVETADPDTVEIEIRGETIDCHPLGVGQRMRPSKKATVAEERGDDLKAVEAVLDMIDLLVDVSPDEYDRDFFDRLGEAELRQTFRTLGQKSGGGNGQ